MEDTPNLSIDSILKNIKREALHLESQGGVQVIDTTQKPVMDFEAWAACEKEFPVKRHYYIHEFLVYDDAEFVRNAYLGILKREPDEVGFDANVSALRRGGSKEQILQDLMMSEEGRAAGIEVGGLARINNELEKKHVYHRDDFLFYDGDEFIHNAYRGLLHRSADEAGFDAHQKYLAGGGFKEIVLAKLCASEEAKEKGIRLEGLTFFKLSRRFIHMRLIGPILQLTIRKSRQLWQRFASKRIDILHQRHQELWAVTDEHLNSQTLWINGIVAEDYARKTRSVNAIEALSDQYLTLQKTINELKTDNVSLREALQQSKQVQDETLRDLGVARNDLLYQQANLRQMMESITESVEGAPETAGHQSVAEVLSEHQEDYLDAYYVAFEEECRGSTAEIQEQQKVYLPVLEAAGTISSAAPLLDVGCGRGEWLQLLKAEGLDCMGVDSNRVMVERCTDLDLSVVKQDALSFLKAQADASLGAVSGFHIIEHLPFPVLFQLFSEALRALVPGGVIVFETPNPENLLVATHTFYHDPTHRNPITPTGIEFLARFTGFSGTEIMRLHPYPNEARVMGVGPLTERVNGHLCGPQDFALVARKPA